MKDIDYYKNMSLFFFTPENRWSFCFSIYKRIPRWNHLKLKVGRVLKKKYMYTD